MSNTYTVKRSSDKQGFRGVSIMLGNIAIANMVMQLDDSEMANARKIVAALNRSSRS